MSTEQRMDAVSVSWSYWTCSILPPPMHLSSHYWSHYTKAYRDHTTQQSSSAVQHSHRLDVMGSRETGWWKQRQGILWPVFNKPLLALPPFDHWNHSGLDSMILRGFSNPMLLWFCKYYHKSWCQFHNVCPNTKIPWTMLSMYQYTAWQMPQSKKKTVINNIFPLSLNPSNCCHNHTKLSATVLQYRALQFP